jgi:hypothetical protein
MSAIFWNESRKAVDATIVAFSCAWNLVALITKSSQFDDPDFMSLITIWKRLPMAEQSLSTAAIASMFQMRKTGMDWIVGTEDEGSEFRVNRWASVR